MSAENAEIVRRAFAVLREEGVEAVMPFIHPDFETTTPQGLAAEPDTYRGHEGIRRWFDTFYEAMDEVAFDIRDTVPVGDFVVVPFALRARGRTTGIEAVQRAVMVWQIEDGLARRVEVFSDLDQALAHARGEPRPPAR